MHHLVSNGKPVSGHGFDLGMVLASSDLHPHTFESRTDPTQDRKSRLKVLPLLFPPAEVPDGLMEAGESRRCCPGLHCA